MVDVRKIDINTTLYKNYTPADWALLWLHKDIGIDGEHHKAWLLDQLVQILNGVEVIVELRTFPNGFSEMEYTLGEPTSAYLDWVKNYKNGEDGAETYCYNKGICP